MRNRMRSAWSSFRRESGQGWKYAVSWFARRLYYRYPGRWMTRSGEGTPADRQRELTVVVPVGDKDVAVLGLCLQAARTLISHRLAAILVVAPASERIREIAESAGCRYVHEDVYLPREVREAKCRGWLLQQIIKLNAAFQVPTNDYLVLDADTVFLRPQCFFCSGRTILRYSDQYELLYNPSLALILGHPRRFPVSFVTHHMMFDARIVKALLACMERRFGRSWHNVIVNGVDHRSGISFSEYELYGNYALAQPGWRRNFRIEYWHGRDCNAEDLPRFPKLRSRAAGQLNCISFHRHTQ